MQTVGCVATLLARFTKSTITMLSPLCESHSLQAASHARQPMQREESTNKVLTATALLLSIHEHETPSEGLGIFCRLILCLANGIWKHFRCIFWCKVFDNAIYPSYGRGGIELFYSRRTGLILWNLNIRLNC